MTNDWKEVAWNGIRFLTPTVWEIGQIGSRHLILEEQTGPAMEVKWGSVKGVFSHKTYLKRLTALHTRQLSSKIQEWKLPSDWKRTLARYEASGFTWQKGDESARGVILYCPVCRTATLIQFFQHISADSMRVYHDILASYHDHHSNDRVFWAVFDVRAALPQRFKLLRYRFDAGRFVLEFDAGKQKITLYRWAPASILLSGNNLVHFIETVPEFAEGNAHTLTIGGRNAVEGGVSPETVWQRWMSRFQFKSAYMWFRVWHLEEKNRILSVRAESKRPLDSLMLKQICNDYEIL